MERMPTVAAGLELDSPPLSRSASSAVEHDAAELFPSGTGGDTWLSLHPITSDAPPSSGGQIDGTENASSANDADESASR